MARLAAALIGLAAVLIPPGAAAQAPAFDSVAPTAILTDLSAGQVLYSRDADRRFIPASLTKIMTAYVAFELMAQGRLQPNQRFTVSDRAFKDWARVGSTMFLGRGDQVSVDDLLRGIITISANDGCIVLAEGVAGRVPAFTALMNAKARELGMTNSHFNTPNGWPDNGATFTTARDLAILSEALISRHPVRYGHYFGRTTMRFNEIEQPNHNPLLGRFPGADGIKTGFTNEAGYGLVGSAQRNGRRLVMVVAGLDRPAVRAREGVRLLEWGYSAWAARPLFARHARVGSARVAGGASRNVDLVAPRALYSVGPIGGDPVPTLTVRYDGPVAAPIRKGQRIGTLIVAATGRPASELPLVAGADVPRGGAFGRLRDGLMSLVGL